MMTDVYLWSSTDPGCEGYSSQVPHSGKGSCGPSMPHKLPKHCVNIDLSGKETHLFFFLDKQQTSE